MNRRSFDQGWHTQFLTKIQKLDGFRELTPCRVCSRYAAYACTEIFCTCRGGAHQYGAWRAGEGPPGRPGRVGVGGDRGACPAHAREPFFEPGLSQRAKKAEKLCFSLSMAFTSSSCP